MIHPNAILPWTLVTCLLAALPSMAQDKLDKVAPIQGTEDRRAAEMQSIVQRVRASVKRLLTEDLDAPAKLLDLFTGGEGEFLGPECGGDARLYAEELAFRELLLLPHDPAEWQEILGRRTWIGSGWIDDRLAPVRPLDPKKFDARWSLDGLDRVLRDMMLQKCKDLARALRELRIYELLDRIPDDRQEAMNRALLAASTAALQAKGYAARLELLHLMERFRSYPPALEAFIWKACSNAPARVKAQSLLVYSSSVKDGSTNTVVSGMLKLRRLKALDDPNPAIAHAAFIGLQYDTLDKKNKARMDARGLSYLSDEALHRARPRLIGACLHYFANTPFGKENLSAAEWGKLLTPILESRESRLRWELVHLPLHRLPESREARNLLKALTADKLPSIRIRAYSEIQDLDLGPTDVRWLTELLGESNYYCRVMLMVSLAWASDYDIDEATTRAFLPWARTEIEKSRTTNWAAPDSYLNVMAINRSLHKSWLPFLLAITKKEKGRLRWLARTTLAAHGWLPDSMAARMRRALPTAKGEEAESILSALHLHAVFNKDREAASKYLDAFLEPAEKNEYFGIHSPILWSAIRAGSLTPKQQSGIVDILYLQDVDSGMHTPCYPQWKVYASLGKAWKKWSSDIEDWIDISTKSIRSKEDGWFEEQKRRRGLELLLEAGKAR